ncbi:carboxyl-terminal processing protease [Litorimonas taeanensis]|uniref:Carboxyl-terminal processing protease n=1 Tax=Litorimonas taeanensis TaxID=568099 RepID=A0A420WJ13_9PROT|nr:S41 family peptidase [Litorimonas taeanensis]RKQ71021.1 carboxyl-terminal processing protease [Litorimonas taeanensis]
MKYILPAIGSVAAIALFAFSSTNQSAIAFEPSSNTNTFEQLDLFADVLARVRTDYVVDVNDVELIENALNGMLQSLDPHSSYVTPEQFKELQVTTSGEYGGLGMEVTMEAGFVKVIAPIDETPAKRAGIKAGDYLTEIDGKSIMGLSLTEAVKQMRGKPGEDITVTVIREDEDPMEITMTREVIKRIVAKYEVKDGLGYIRLAQFNDKAEEGVVKAIKELSKEFGGKIPGLILDLRGNPGGLLDQSVKVSSVFLDGGEVVSTRGRVASDTQRYNGEAGELAKDVPIVVLIDGASASASEIVAGALQDRGRAIILGMTSFGKGSVQSIIPLRGGRDGGLRMTTQRYYTPAGRSIQGTGIEPDIAVSFVPDDGKKRLQRREADLPNAIKNENEDTETEELVVDYPPEDYDPEGDYQLEKAIELLKGGNYVAKLAEFQG